MRHESWHNEEYMKGKRRDVVRIARGLLSEQIGIIEGSRLLDSLRFEVSDSDFDPDFLGFVAIASETDHLPVGSVRSNWSSEALKEKDIEIKEAEDFYRKQVIEDCKKLIERFEKVNNEIAE